MANKYSLSCAFFVLFILGSTVCAAQQDSQLPSAPVPQSAATAADTLPAAPTPQAQSQPIAAPNLQTEGLTALPSADPQFVEKSVPLPAINSIAQPINPLNNVATETVRSWGSAESHADELRRAPSEVESDDAQNEMPRGGMNAGNHHSDGPPNGQAQPVNWNNLIRNFFSPALRGYGGGPAGYRNQVGQQDDSYTGESSFSSNGNSAENFSEAGQGMPGGQSAGISGNQAASFGGGFSGMGGQHGQGAPEGGQVGGQGGKGGGPGGHGRGGGPDGTNGIEALRPQFNQLMRVNVDTTLAGIHFNYQNSLGAGGSLYGTGGATYTNTTRLMGRKVDFSAAAGFGSGAGGGAGLGGAGGGSGPGGAGGGRISGGSAGGPQGGAAGGHGAPHEGQGGAAAGPVLSLHLSF